MYCPTKVGSSNLTPVSLRLRLDLEKICRKKQFRKVTFFLVFDLEKITKKKWRKIR